MKPKHEYDERTFKNLVHIAFGGYINPLFPPPSPQSLPLLLTHDELSSCHNPCDHDLRVLSSYCQCSPSPGQVCEYDSSTLRRALVVSQDPAVVGPPPKKAGDYHRFKLAEDPLQGVRSLLMICSCADGRTAGQPRGLR